ncbi:MAG: TonB-dependent receptor [Bacteroidaceae bacterium]|nr:TonB-dependent receptor [Bacteroidaceae bacterium]
MKKFACIVTLSLLFPVGTRGQTVVEGAVTDLLGRAVDAFVTVRPKGAGGILAYTDTDERGHYRLSFNTQADSVAVTASGMTIGNRVRLLANRSQRVDFRVSEQQMELREVTVRAEKIRQQGDTLNYNVAAYQQQGDRVIGDVLKRMPGIEVSDNGAIKYNGKAIRKFYVEEMDLLQGRYGLATNNINAQDVATVQVMEHHQEKKMLRGKEMTDDVAINLKLKNSAKGTVAVNTMVGGGWQDPPHTLPAREGAVGNQTLTSYNVFAPFLTGRAGGGAVLWTAEAVGMYFAKTRQNMTVYKGNNAGDDVSRELTSHYSINSIPLYPFCPTGVIMPSGSGLSQKRTFDNRSNIVSTNHLEKLSPDKEMTFNAAYYNDRIRREGYAESNQFLSEADRLLTQETMTSETTLHNLSAQARYCNNSSGAFLADVLKVDAGWNTDRVSSLLSSSRVDVQGLPVADYGDEQVAQHFRRPTLSVSNTFNTTQAIGRNHFDLHFSAGYARRPNTLTVGIEADPPLAIPVREGAESDSEDVTSPSFSANAGGGAVYRQDLTSHHIAARFNTGYNLRVGDYFKFNYGINASANLHGIETDLDGFTPPADGGWQDPPHTLPTREEVVSSQTLTSYNVFAPSLTGRVGGGSLNDLWYNTYTLALGQSYKYEIHDFSLTLGLPLELYAQTLDDRVRDDRHGYVHLLFAPSLSMNWSITRDLWFNAGAHYSKTVGDPGGIYSGYIMSNYRTFQRSYVEQLSETQNLGAQASLRYRSAIHAFFANAGFNYRRTHDNQIYGYTYEGATSVVQGVNQPTVANSYSLSGEVSKGFDFLRSTIRAFAGYSLSASERLIGGQLYQYHARAVSGGGNLSFSPFEWMGIVYSTGFSFNWSKTLTDTASPQTGGWEGTTVRSHTQRLSMSIFPTKKLTLTLAAEDNYNNLTATHRHAWFGDAAAKLKLKRVDMELQLNNLFNQHRYSRVTYSGLDIFTHTSQLRPRNALFTIRFKLL